MAALLYSWDPARQGLVEDILVVCRVRGLELVPSVRLFVIECLDYPEWSIHLLRPQHLRDDHGQVPDLVERRTQLLLAERSRLEDDSCFGRDECQSESRSRSPATVCDLFE